MCKRTALTGHQIISINLMYHPQDPPQELPAAAIPAGKQAVERDAGLCDDRKWLASGPQPPYTPGKPLPGQYNSLDRSHEDGLRLSRRTSQLNQDNRRVLCSSVHLMLPDEELVHDPTGFLPPPYYDWPMTVLLLGDSRHTPDEIAIIPEGKFITGDLMSDTGANVTIIPQAKWLCDWEPVSACGTISGMGGAVNSFYSKHLLAVLDIKDCFFNILLYPGDAPRFAFSVPSVNGGEPYKREYPCYFLENGTQDCEEKVTSEFICE
ncbi:hypothetical protein RLOC_00000152 [Lonchura striata]|uniref:Peptidase A2 domain-containing protein n=1 Tax=Lonchura striata TaxID=40157 RepID=A0A218V0Z1_9PASE|nr:hypothetical protein RLOC_00000152 [Lonchura striata domestica]